MAPSGPTRNRRGRPKADSRALRDSRRERDANPGLIQKEDEAQQAERGGWLGPATGRTHDGNDRGNDLELVGIHWDARDVSN